MANAEEAERVLGFVGLGVEEKKSEMLGRVVVVAGGGEVLVMVLVLVALGVEVEEGGRLWSSS